MTFEEYLLQTEHAVRQLFDWHQQPRLHSLMWRFLRQPENAIADYFIWLANETF
jgi:hypothetical protein